MAAATALMVAAMEASEPTESHPRERVHLSLGAGVESRCSLCFIGSGQSGSRGR